MRCPVNYLSIVQRRHKGYEAIDFGWGCEKGKEQPVYAVDDGMVIYNRYQITGGYVIEIQHDNGLISEYGHLKKDSQRVLEGYRVKKGQQIANMGSSGIVSGMHLHFELKKSNGIYTGHKKSIDAMPYLNIYDGQEIVANKNKEYPKHTLHVTAKDGLNVRTGRGTKYKIVKVAPYGSEVEDHGTKDGWLCIDNIRGYYVSAKWVK